MIELDVISFSLLSITIVGLFYLMLRKIIALHREVSNLNIEISDHERQLVGVRGASGDVIRLDLAVISHVREEFRYPRLERIQILLSQKADGHPPRVIVLAPVPQEALPDLPLLPQNSARIPLLSVKHKWVL